MKTIRQHLETLPEPIRSKAMRNLISGEDVRPSIRTALFAAFPWGGTPEGFDFWDEVAHNKMELFWHIRTRSRQLHYRRRFNCVIPVNQTPEMWLKQFHPQFRIIKSEVQFLTWYP
jgi:hypothetical protein